MQMLVVLLFYVLIFAGILILRELSWTDIDHWR